MQLQFHYDGGICEPCFPISLKLMQLKVEWSQVKVHTKAINKSSAHDLIKPSEPHLECRLVGGAQSKGFGH